MTTNRFTAVIRCWLVAAAVALLFHPAARAQSTSAADPNKKGTGRGWLDKLAIEPNAGLAWSPVSVSFDDSRAETEKGLWLHFGLRTSPLALFCGDSPRGICTELAAITITPHIAYGATHLRGMNPDTDPFAYSTIDPQSIQISYAVTKRVRPMFLFRHGRTSAELFENGDFVNYWGSATSWGFGFEVPMTPKGRGLEVALLRRVGSFDTKETRDAEHNVKVIGPATKSFRAVAFQIGWSGPFTGVSLPWQ